MLCALLGSICCARWLGCREGAAAMVGMVAIATLRLAAILWGLHLPVLPMRDE